MTKVHRIFTPRSGSLTWQVLNYLLSHRDEVLSRREIFEQFNVLRIKGIAGQLRPAVEAQALVVVRKDDQMSWKLGVKPNVILDEGPPVALKHLDDDAPSHDPFGITKPVNLAEIPVLLNTPLAPELREETEVRKWLAKFEVGSSAEFPLSQADHVRRQIERFGKSFGRFRMRRGHRPNMAGVERIA